MKKFNLQKYISNPSRKVVTRDGRLVRILCTDARGEYPIVALTIENNLRDMVLICEADGTDIRSENNDLFFDVETKHGWVNLCRTERGFIVFGSIFDTKEDALDEIKKIDDVCKYIDTIQIEWEEES